MHVMGSGPMVAPEQLLGQKIAQADMIGMELYAILEQLQIVQSRILGDMPRAAPSGASKLDNAHSSMLGSLGHALDKINITLSGLREVAEQLGRL